MVLQVVAALKSVKEQRVVVVLNVEDRSSRVKTETLSLSRKDNMSVVTLIRVVSALCTGIDAIQAWGIK